MNVIITYSNAVINGGVATELTHCLGGVELNRKPGRQNYEINQYRHDKRCGLEIVRELVAFDDIFVCCDCLCCVIHALNVSHLCFFVNIMP